VNTATPNQPKVHSTRPEYTLFDHLLGYVRVGIAFFTAALCCVVLSLVNLVNIRIKGRQATNWVAIPFARLIYIIFNIGLTSHNVETLKNHKGIIVANHSSLLDIPTLAYHLPVRFLAAIEVKHRPLIGRISKFAGVIFVTRDDLHSRNAATSEIIRALKAQPDLPVVIFPEGRIGDGRAVGLFQRGAFWIAAKNNVKVLPCSIEYTPEEVAIWDGNGECFDNTIWPLARHSGRVHTVLTVLEPFQPTVGEDPKEVAFETRHKITQSMGFSE